MIIFFAPFPFISWIFRETGLTSRAFNSKIRDFRQILIGSKQLGESTDPAPRHLENAGGKRKKIFEVIKQTAELAPDYRLDSTIKSTAALISSSDKAGLPPFGGIRPFPFIAD